MGYAVHRFVGKVDENLICGVCSEVLQEAVLTPCGHSFCHGCLETWLARPGCATCPECRGCVMHHEARPILAVRSLINGLCLRCENDNRGCTVVTKLDRIKVHLESCGYVPVNCAGCSKTLNRCDLPSHHIQCEGIAAAVRDEETTSVPLSSHGCTIIHGSHCASYEVAELACKIASLEIQLKRMKRDLELADIKNKRLERELQQTKIELQEKRNQLLDHEYVDFDPDYDYGYVPHTISKLSCLIARFLLKKPSYVDHDRIFNCIKRCYDQYARCGDSYEHDVHMLIATSYASNWFTDNQKLSIHCWLHSIARYRRFSHELLRRDDCSNIQKPGLLSASVISH